MARCLRQPQLFYQDPKTIDANLFGDGTYEVNGKPRKGVVILLHERGLEIANQQWLDACLKAPPLFYRDPQAIAGHVDTAIYVAGVLRENGAIFPKPMQKEAKEGLEGNQLILQRLLNSPANLHSSDESLHLRLFTALYQYDDLAGTKIPMSLITSPRSAAETLVIEALGGRVGEMISSDSSEPNTVLLRALMHGGLITQAALDREGLEKIKTPKNKKPEIQ